MDEDRGPWPVILSKVTNTEEAGGLVTSKENELAEVHATTERATAKCEVGSYEQRTSTIRSQKRCEDFRVLARLPHKFYNHIRNKI